MKKILVVLSLVIATSFTAFAQKPVAGAKGFTFGLNPIFTLGPTQLNAGPASTGTLLFRYYVADDIAARFSINYTKSSTTITDTASFSAGLGEESVEKTKSSTFAVQVGAQKSFGESEKLEPYVGADLLFSKTSGKYNFRQETVNTKGGGTVGDFVEVDANGTPGGGGYNGSFSTIGLVPVVGFNYYFTENFSVGAEFGWGILMSSSDKKPVEEVVTSKTGATTTTNTNYYNSDARTKTTDFQTRGQGIVTVSVLF